MPKPEATRVLEAICTAQWLITEPWLNTIIGIADRSHSDFQAVLASRGEPLANADGVVVRNGVAVVPVIGPIFRYANLFTMLSGATSLDVLATSFGQAVGNPAVKAIVLEIDSPGGMAAGISEFASQVRDASKVKPVVAYVSDKGASAAYWIAAAASELVMSDTAQVGSIGTVMTAMRSIDDGTIKIISSQSPLKQARPDSEAGQKLYQAQIDQLAQIFIDAVAQYRGVSAETVVNDFGQGFTLVGAKAVAAGMADRLGTLESIIAGLSGDNRMRKLTMNITRDTIAAEHPSIADAFRNEGLAAATVDTLSAANPVVAAALRADGARAERERIKGVKDASLPGYEAQIETMMFDGKTAPGEAALAINKAAREALGRQATAIAADGSELRKVPGAEPPAGAQGDDENDQRSVEVRAKADWDTKAAIRAEFRTIENYTAYLRASEKGQIRILKNRQPSKDD